MPGYPRIDKGEGLIRTHDLLEVLHADMYTAYATLESDRQSQYLRRCVVRAIFSYIEAIVECIKVELRSTVRLGYYTGLLSPKEEETLGPLTIIDTREANFLPLDQNIKRTFKLATKVWELKFRLATSGEDFRDFLAAKSARNRLSHPRTFYGIEVTDHDMHRHTVAGMWVQSEFRRLFKERVKSLAAGLPEEDREALLKATALREDGEDA